MVDLNAVLAEVNALRTRLGFAPLPALRTGKRSKSCNCPLANSLREIFEVKGAKPDVLGNRIKLPASYAALNLETYEGYNFDNFIDEFDDGGFPHLDSDIVGDSAF